MRAGGACCCLCLLAMLGPGLAAVLQPEETGQENPVRLRHRMQLQGHHSDQRERRAASGSSQPAVTLPELGDVESHPAATLPELGDVDSHPAATLPELGDVESQPTATRPDLGDVESRPVLKPSEFGDVKSHPTVTLPEHRDGDYRPALTLTDKSSAGESHLGRLVGDDESTKKDITLSKTLRKETNRDIGSESLLLTAPEGVVSSTAEMKESRIQKMTAGGHPRPFETMAVNDQEAEVTTAESLSGGGHHMLKQLESPSPSLMTSVGIPMADVPVVTSPAVAAKQEERRRRIEKLQRNLLERRQEMRRKKTTVPLVAEAPASKDGLAPVTSAGHPVEEDEAIGSKQHREDKGLPHRQGHRDRDDNAHPVYEEEEDDEDHQPPRRGKSRAEDKPHSRRGKENKPREQEPHDNSLSEDWDFSSENSVEWDGLVCPAAGEVSILSSQCRSLKDCAPVGERCCRDRWGLQRCVQGVEPKLPDIPHEPFFGVIARVCPSFDDTLVEPWAITNCTSDDDCWPRVCCVDGSRAYCRTPQIEWEKLPGQRFVAPLRLLMSYLQCTQPPPPMFDLFPKTCRNTLDCFPNLCCQEHGNKVCRPPKRSLLALLATIGHSAGFNLRSQQQQQSQNNY